METVRGASAKAWLSAIEQPRLTAIRIAYLHLQDVFVAGDSWFGTELDISADHLAVRLPLYAHPQFVRIRNALDIAEKMNEQRLVGQGFDPDQTDELLYFKNPELSAFRPLDAERFSEIVAGKIRFSPHEEAIFSRHAAEEMFNRLAREINV